ncbi:site-specific integrase [Methylocystis sp. ATCC 49242]|uniref:tyrosine-type recombinase/integrase n=1 Tax=Methylocystis sp. ATCC 49242 TaxID=622637 RepID=UPI0001F87118|nr:site-specific integrase [Methylocystis sp. ATCC 49242]
MPKLYERPDSPYWYAEITNHDGKIKRVSTNIPRGRATQKRALEVALQKEQELKEQGARRLSVSLEQASFEFLDASTKWLKASTRRHYALKLTKILKATPIRPALCDLTVDWVRDFVRLRREATTDIQIRRELTALSSVIEFAIDREMEGAPKENPCHHYRKKGLAQPVKKPRWLKLPEVRKLLDAAKGDRFWHPFITLILETGMRHEEALGLPWSEVDLDRKIITLGWEREKAKRGRIIPLSNTALHTLTHLSRLTACPYVFVNHRTGDRYKSIGAGWRRLRLRAGVPKARIHDLRHTFASWTRQSGMSREDRKDVLGHLDDTTHGGYANGSIETLLVSINKHSPSTLLSQEQEL